MAVFLLASRIGSTHALATLQIRRATRHHCALNQLFSTQSTSLPSVLRPNESVPQVRDVSILWLEEHHPTVLEPQESVYHLLAHALDLDWDQGFVRVRNGYDLNDRIVTREESQRFASLLERRLQHEPLQYILGQWDFLNHQYRIRPPLLCPRPETEELVVKIQADYQSPRPPPRHILDIGCGTGCIGIELAKHFPQARVTAIDVEPIAVETSLQNAERILLPQDAGRYEAFQCAAADFVSNTKFDLIVSNPPYIPPNTNLDPTVVDYESPQALFGGGVDGMDVIRDIISNLPEWCSLDDVSTPVYCWMEVDPSQPPLLQELLSEANENKASSVGTNVAYHSTHLDMFGQERFVKLEMR